MAEENLQTYVIRTPDGSTAFVKAPKGATEESIFEYLFEQQAPARLSGAVAREISLPLAGAAAGAAAGSLIGGVGAIPGAVAGLTAGTLAPLVADPAMDLFNSIFKTNYQRPSDALNELFTRAGLPDPATTTEQVLQEASAGTSESAGMVGLGKILSKMPNPIVKGVGLMLQSQPAAQVAGGAAGAASSELAEQADLPLVAQLGLGIAGGQLGARMFTPRVSLSPDELQQAQSAIAEAERLGIPLMTTDVREPGRVGAASRSVLENIPLFGTKGVRSQQVEKGKEAIDRLLKDYLEDYNGFNAKDLPDMAEDIAQNVYDVRSSRITKYTNLKDEVKEKLSTAGSVPVNRLLSLFDKEIAEYSQRGAAYKGYVEDLIKFRDSAPLSNKSINMVESFRQDLGKLLNKDQKTGTVINDHADKFYKKAYSALRDDISQFIREKGSQKDLDKWNIANKELSESASELFNASWKSALKRGKDTPEAIANFLFKTDKSQVRQIYRSLDEEGRSNARIAILSRAAKNSFVNGEIDADRFLASLKGSYNSIGVFFSGYDKERINGLANILQYTSRARKLSKAEERSGNGVLAWLLGAGGASGGGYYSISKGLIDPFSAAAAAVATGGAIKLAKFYESPAVRDILLKFGKKNINQKEEAALFKRFATQAQRYLSDLEEQPMEEVVVTAGEQE